MNDKAPKMMPDQDAYTPEQLKQLQDLLNNAAEATEVFSEDELEAHAAEQRRKASAP